MAAYSFAVQQPLFEGPGSLRDPTERVAFWLTAIFAFPAAATVGFFIHASIGISQVALLIVIAMIYVTLARGRLLGSSVMVHEKQYPRVFAIVKRTCAALDIPMPLVFVHEDNFVPIAALGFGEPYSLVVSSHWIEVFRDDELAFMIGRELGHIAAGHTRFLSLLSVNGNENAFVSAIFGAWLRRCSLTCDKVGLLCCGSLDAAIRAIGVAAFHEFGRRIDYDAFIEQQKEIENDAVMRWGAWLGREPYATVRIASLNRFMATQAFELHERWFLRELGDEPVALALPGTSTVERIDCATWWRRFWAFSIDVVVVLLFIGSVHSIISTPFESFIANNGALVLHKALGPHAGLVLIPLTRLAVLLALYFTILVAIVGQTFGMMIVGLRVVTISFQRPGVARTVCRYGIALVLWPLIAAGSPFAHRVYLHDRLTGTRLITAERLLVRAVLPVAP